MKTIEEKGNTYREQMRVIREKVAEFGELHGCEPVPRGRRGHASLACDTNSTRGIIDIQMIPVDWDQMPESIPDEWPFEIWCSATQNRSQVSQEEIFWELPFSEVEKHLERFLQEAWSFLNSLGNESFTDQWPEPSSNPDRMPHLSGPKQRNFKAETPLRND